MTTTRREAMGLMAGSLVLPVCQAASTPRVSEVAPRASKATWGAGIEGQRMADLGNGTFLNPIMAGDHPDPSILKDGEDYYLTFSSFDAYPALIIWHSRDLVNWTPLGPALSKNLGSVFAVDLAKHDGRYFIYIPVVPAVFTPGAAPTIHVIHADHIAGPWSEPIDLGISGFIDPGHVVGEDGKRYLFLSGVSRIRLRDDGLATDGTIEPVYDGWRYPDDWITEAYSLEGPKLLRRADYFYLITAVGGTSGPPTGHMVIVARSRSIHGPWENCPYNPIVRTRSDMERWWSRGHATVVRGLHDEWWMVYHGYENGYRTLGRQTLLEPIEWTSDGWFRAVGGDLSVPLAKPKGGSALPHGIARSDDFTTLAFGTRWHFYSPDENDGDRARLDAGGIVITGQGSGPHDSSPLAGLVGDQAYQVSVKLELRGETQGGLLLFFNRHLFLGMGHDGTSMTTYRGGHASYWHENAPKVRTLHMRIVNDHHIVTFYYSEDGNHWTRHSLRSEVSGYHANVMDDLVSLRPALFATGAGSVRFSHFVYRALP